MARVIQGQAQLVPGIFRIQARQLSWAPRDSSQGQSFKVALEAITGILLPLSDLVRVLLYRRLSLNKIGHAALRNRHKMIRALAAIGTLQRAKSRPQMRVATISGPLMLEFESMEARDAAIARITPLLAGAAQSSRPASGIEPTGPLSNVKKQLLEEDRCV